MNRHDFTRMLIEGTVGRTLNQMQKDPHRSIRNLVDLGLTFSRGRFQQTFLELAQAMLENQQSAYYDLLDMLIHQVHPENIKTFGINLGYEGLTRGADTIRSIEAIGSYNIPWMLSIDCGGSGLDLATLRDMLRQGISQGIYTYCLIGPDTDLSVIQELTAAFPLCAFLLLTTGENLLRQDLDLLEPCRNLFTAVETGGDGLEAAEALFSGGFFYGIYRRYEDGACIAPEALEHYLDYRPAAVFLLPGSETALSQSLSLYPRVKELRMAQKYPYFLMEAVQDSLYIDGVISRDPCMLHIQGDGTALGVARSGVRTAGSILDAPLVQLLRQTVPKARPMGQEG